MTVRKRIELVSAGIHAEPIRRYYEGELILSDKWIAILEAHKSPAMRNRHMTAARARLWCLAGALLPAALIAWLRYSAVLDFGCETWQHETCGIFFRCARCVHPAAL
jgi:hypothetical protein